MPNQNADSNTYDRGIVPAETAARMEREGDNYKELPDEEGEDSIDTTGGFTVDQEGLLNNYAIEPEMYYEVPGDAKQAEEEDLRERAQELKEVNETNEDGKLTSDHDSRGKGTGVI
ncbi:hypothetical protein AB3R30_10525 [Leptolyngbyaceae cyanobacterium UHCC 1019]